MASVWYMFSGKKSSGQSNSVTEDARLLSVDSQNSGGVEPKWTSASGTHYKSSVADTVKKMTCIELAHSLRKFLDDVYESDVKKLKDEKIDGKLFLTLPDKPKLLEKLKLSAGGEEQIREIVHGIKVGSSLFGRARNRELVEPDMPWCSTEIPVAMPSGVTATTGWAAWIPSDVVWLKEIYVEFLYVNLLANWTIDGQRLNTDTILRYANTWNDMGGGEIPRFVEANYERQAQILVSFNNDHNCNFQNIPAKEPTINLDLHNGCPSDQYKKHVIIHEFGHALGLDHEHQRSNFWSLVKSFTDFEKMRKDLNMTEEKFALQWKDFETGQNPKYDPDSIMHYSFKAEWLTSGYSDKEKVEKDQSLTGEIAEALLGIHKRCNALAEKPSDLDIQLLKKAYHAHILTKFELQILSGLLEGYSYSNEKVKEIQESIQTKQGGDISRQEVEKLLQGRGQAAIACKLEENLRKGVEKEELFKAYKAALEGERTLTLRYLRFVLIGVPRSGKSTMRRRLLQEIVNLRSLGQPLVSTGLAETCHFVVKKITSKSAAISGSQWIKRSSDARQHDCDNDGDLHYFTHLFYSLISKASTDAALRSDPATSKGERTNVATNVSKIEENNTTNEACVNVKGTDKQQNSTNNTDKSVPVLCSESDRKEVDKAFDKLTNILQSDCPEDLHKLLEALTLINLTDVGGQPEFLDMLPLLTIGAALYFLFFRLDQDLHEHYPVTFYTPGDTYHKELDTSYCTEEVIHQALASIACVGGYSSTSTGESASSHAALFGTYSDKVTTAEIAEKEKDVKKQFFSSELCKKLLLIASKGRHFFTVDNMNGTEESEMSEIRMEIDHIVKKYFAEVPIPASWLMFRIVLHLMNKPVVTLTQCKEIACRLSMATPVKALSFFHHDIGSLLYYEDIPSVKDLVICTPQVIFDSMTTVIIDNFKYSCNISANVMERFQQKGLFSLSDISKKTERHRSTHLSPKQLVDVLKHNNILAEVKCDDEEAASSEPVEPKFIIPAVLKHASEEELKPSTSLEASPLMIHFNGGFVPFGVFSASIARLIARANSLSPKWSLHGNEIQKNKVKFLVAKGFVATLISRPQYLEIQIEKYPRARCKHTLAHICSTVQQTVVETLEATISKMKYQPQHSTAAATFLSSQRPFDLAFTCCLHDHEPHSDHLMKVVKEEDEYYGECLRDGAQTDLDKDNLMWFGQDKQPSESEATATSKSIVSSTSSALTIQDLDEVKKAVRNAHEKWKQIGEELGIDADELDLTEISHRNKTTEECLTDVLKKFLKQKDRRPSWKRLAYAMASKNVGCKDIAAKLCKKYW